MRVQSHQFRQPTNLVLNTRLLFECPAISWPYEPGTFAHAVNVMASVQANAIAGLPITAIWEVYAFLGGARYVQQTSQATLTNAGDSARITFASDMLVSTCLGATLMLVGTGITAAAIQLTYAASVQGRQGGSL